MCSELGINIFSQNCRGLNDDGEEELLEKMRGNAIDVCILQETWKSGDSTVRNGDFTLIFGRPKSSAGRGRNSGGVGFVLNYQGAKCWEAAGSQILKFGDRVLAIRLCINKMENVETSIYFW